MWWNIQLLILASLQGDGAEQSIFKWNLNPIHVTNKLFYLIVFLNNRILSECSFESLLVKTCFWYSLFGVHVLTMLPFNHLSSTLYFSASVFIALIAPPILIATILVCKSNMQQGETLPQILAIGHIILEGKLTSLFFLCISVFCVFRLQSNIHVFVCIAL